MNRIIAYLSAFDRVMLGKVNCRFMYGTVSTAILTIWHSNPRAVRGYRRGQGASARALAGGRAAGAASMAVADVTDGYAFLEVHSSVAKCLHPQSAHSML